MRLEELTHEMKVLLVVLRGLERLKEAGYVTGPDCMTDEGRRHADALEAAGFRPAPEEISRALSALRKRAG